MNETTMTLVGNLVADPELRYTPQGQPVARFRVASTPRYFDKQAQEWRDGEALFLTVNAWRQLAEHVGESLNQGSRVIVSGRLRHRSYEKDGATRTVYELEADEVGASLRNATVKISKTERTKSPAGNGGGRQGEADPWAAGPSSGYSDDPPF